MKSRRSPSPPSPGGGPSEGDHRSPFTLQRLSEKVAIEMPKLTVPPSNAAMLEAKMALATTLHGFDLADVGERVDEVMSFTMHPSNLRLKMTPRQR